MFQTYNKNRNLASLNVFFTPNIETNYGPGFPMSIAMRNLNGWSLTFH